jgi:hydroxymethylpyrimidine/phosphomethylpyrimidine kinase
LPPLFFPTIGFFTCVKGDSASLLIALAACLLGYGEVGLWLQREARRQGSCVTIEDNPYKTWIEDYSGESYQAAVKAGIGAYWLLGDAAMTVMIRYLERIEALAARDPPSHKKMAHWQQIWGRCTLLEKQFWDMAMNIS